MLKLILGMLLLSPLALAAETTAHVTSRASVSVVSDTDAVSPGVAYHVGLRFQLAPGWHIYSRDPGDAGIPPELTWEGAEVGPIAWPAPQRFSEGDLVTRGYAGEVLLASEARGSGLLQLRANWLICNNICVPEEASFTLKLPEGIAAPSAEAPLFATLPQEASAGLWQALLFALLGGLILNVMPCVFPILAMKGFAIARLSGESRQAARQQAWLYTLGVMLSFAGIGLGLLGLRQAGESLGWGFQFQSPVFVVVITWVLFAVGLNLSGVFEVNSRLAGVGQGLVSREGWMGSFFAGVLAVLVATPCTAPFMGAAIAAALTAPGWQTVLVFLAMGLGLATPTTLVAMIPAVTRALPRPGAWMVVLKQALAFPMYAATAWLVWVASVQSGEAGVLSAVAGLVLVGFAAWVQRFGRRFGRGLAGLALLVLLTLLPDLRSGNDTPEIADRYTPQRLAELRAEGRPVFVNMTAAWCVTCLVNERVALHPQSVQAAFALGNVAYLKGDWTRQDPEITRFLHDKGRDGVPLYVFYPAHGGAPIVLPQVLTPAALLQALSG
jgi:thiol:disulfide interchange protein